MSLANRDGFQSLPGRHGLVVGIGFSDLSFGVAPIDGEVTGPVEIKIGIERVGVEAIDGRRVFFVGCGCSR